jgi:hypothetical protein
MAIEMIGNQIDKVILDHLNDILTLQKIMTFQSIQVDDFVPFD